MTAAAAFLYAYAGGAWPGRLQRGNPAWPGQLQRLNAAWLGQAQPVHLSCLVCPQTAFSGVHNVAGSTTPSLPACDCHASRWCSTRRRAGAASGHLNGHRPSGGVVRRMWGERLLAGVFGELCSGPCSGACRDLHGAPQWATICTDRQGDFQWVGAHGGNQGRPQWRGGRRGCGQPLLQDELYSRLLGCVVSCSPHEGRLQCCGRSSA